MTKKLAQAEARKRSRRRRPPLGSFRAPGGNRPSGKPSYAPDERLRRHPQTRLGTVNVPLPCVSAVITSGYVHCVCSAPTKEQGYPPTSQLDATRTAHRRVVRRL